MRHVLPIALCLASLYACSPSSPSTPAASASASPAASTAPAGPDFVPTTLSLTIDGATATILPVGKTARPTATDFTVGLGTNTTSNPKVAPGAYNISVTLNLLKKDPSAADFALADAGQVVVGLNGVTAAYALSNYVLDTKTGLTLALHDGLMDLDFDGVGHAVTGTTVSPTDAKIKFSAKGIPTKK